MNRRELIGGATAAGGAAMLTGSARRNPWLIAADIVCPSAAAGDDNRRPKQMPPSGDWRIALWHPGRGWGKGYALSHLIRDRVRAGTARQIALVGSTRQAVRQVMIEKERSGILEVCPEATYVPSRAEVRWPNGAKAFIHSAEKPDNLRGPDFDFAWADEIDSWGLETTNAKAQAAWENLELAVRVGLAQIGVTSTPKPGRMVAALVRRAAEQGDVVVITGSMYENADNLSPAFVEAMERRYKGTRLERQELHGEILDEIHGALWVPSMFKHRDVEPEHLSRAVVGVDPSGGGDMIGIVAAGSLGHDEYAVLDDWSIHGSPAVWARRAVDLLEKWGGDCIVAEKNFGGDMVLSTIRNAGAEVPVRMVSASRGKSQRAEPVALMYEQQPDRASGNGGPPDDEQRLPGRVWHRRGAKLDLLEDEYRRMTVRGFEGEGSPNRLDACIAEGELVMTRTGEVGIEAVRPGDEVWTRAGWRKVEAARCVGVRPTMTVEMDSGHRLCGTPDHRIWTEESGWTRLDELVCGVTVSAWTTQQRLSTTGSRTSEILAPTIVRTACTIRRRAGQVASTFIEKFTRAITDLFLTAMSSIIVTATRSTTIQPIWWLSPGLSMLPSIPSSLTMSGWNTWQQRGKRRPSGMDRTREGGGIGSMPGGAGKRESRTRSRVRNAAMRLRRGSRGRSFALGGAREGGPTENTGTKCGLNARSAKTSSGRTSTYRSPRPVRASVVRSYASGVRTVYDLQVSEVHEFVASGVVVHNCVWSLTHLAGRGGDQAFLYGDEYDPEEAKALRDEEADLDRRLGLA